ncbi:TPA: purine-nucleoside phosphorylase [Candidatus Avigastranaerophilus faecigallinarum]|nr:purine-nucleoside phosphorylase [Candidatus Avigastranaerophilus faecigallinarum]
MESTINYIKEKIQGFQPEIGIILGSGLGDFADEFESIIIPYNDIPGFEKSNVQGHKGQLVFAQINGKKVVMMQGRYHFYEGYSMQTVTFPVKVMKKLGVKTLIITNAAGAVTPEFTPGDLMLITDHINFMGTNPLIGKNDETLGTRFPDMSEVYSKELIQTAEAIAKKLNINYQKGVYAATTGPSYETPSEVKMFRMLGANAVGMSTAPEAIVANYCGLKILGISCLTNYAAGVSETPLNHQEVIDTANRVKESFKNLLSEILKSI